MAAMRPGNDRRRRTQAGWWLGLLALVGCTSTVQSLSQPMGPPLGMPLLRDDAVITADGYRLPLRVWRPEGRTVAVLLAVHGFNDYANAYANAGPVFARHGILTYAYDQRGFGATREPGVWPGTATLVSDVQTVAGLLLRRHPGLPLYLLGESMGGAVVMTALADPLPPGSPLARVAGAVLVAPAVWGRETMAPLPRLALAVTNTLVPGIALTAPRELHIRPSDNDEMLRAYGRDPLVIKATRVDAMNGLVALMSDALASAPRFRVPGLVLYGVHDQILPHAAIERMLSSLPAGRQRIAVYRDGWHMLLRDRQGDVVVDDIVAWIREPSAPLPSGADRRPPGASGRAAFGP
jgi:alpha-beta hydrolase superfamily lysophospholipase